MKLTQEEKYLLMHLIRKNEQDGEYYGNRAQYFKRLNSIKSKLKSPPKLSTVFDTSQHELF